MIRERLARARFARLAFVEDGQPLIVPVNTAVDGASCVVFRTAPGTTLAKLDGHRVAIEIDAHDPALHTGWSILIRGVARHISDALERDAVRLRSLPVDCWARGHRDPTVTVLPVTITSRMIHVADNGDRFAGVLASWLNVASPSATTPGGRSWAHGEDRRRDRRVQRSCSRTAMRVRLTA